MVFWRFLLDFHQIHQNLLKVCAFNDQKMIFQKIWLLKKPTNWLSWWAQVLSLKSSRKLFSGSKVRILSINSFFFQKFLSFQWFFLLRFRQKSEMWHLGWRDIQGSNLTNFFDIFWKFSKFFEILDSNRLSFVLFLNLQLLTGP